MQSKNDTYSPQTILHNSHPSTNITLGYKIYISLTDTESDCARHPAKEMLASTDFSTLGKFSIKTQKYVNDFDCIHCLKNYHRLENIKQLPNGDHCIRFNCGHYQAGTAKFRTDCMICKYQSKIDKHKTTEYSQIVIHEQNIFLSGSNLLICYCEDCDKLYYISHNLITTATKIVKDINSCSLNHRSNDFSLMYGLNLKSTIRLVYEVMFESSAADFFSVKNRFSVDAYNKRVRVAVVHPMFNNNILELQGLCAMENITLITLGLDTVHYYEIIRDIHLALDRRNMTIEPLNVEIMEYYQKEFLNYYHAGEFIIYKPHSIFMKDPPPDGFVRSKVSKYLDQEFAGGGNGGMFKAPPLVKPAVTDNNTSTASNDISEEILYVPEAPVKEQKAFVPEATTKEQKVFVPETTPVTTPVNKETKIEKIKQLIKKSPKVPIPETPEQRLAAETKKKDEANVANLTRQFKMEKEKKEPPLLNLDMTDTVEVRPVKKYIPDDLVLAVPVENIELTELSETTELTEYTVDMEKMVDALVYTI